MPNASSRSQLTAKQQASAEEILDAAARAFSRRGYAATSIDDVADELGCTKGRVYHYFRTKGQLFIGIHRRALVWALEGVRPVAEDDTRSAPEKLEMMVRAHAMHLMEHADYMGPAQHHTEMNLAREGRTKEDSVADIFEMRHEFEELFVQVMKDGMATGEFAEADPVLVARAVLGSVNWMNVWFRTGSQMDTPESRDEIADVMSRIALRGVLA